jgi:hypothetical protein
MMHQFPKGRAAPGLLRTVLKRDLRGRPVETAPFTRSWCNELAQIHCECLPVGEKGAAGPEAGASLISPR